MSTLPNPYIFGFPLVPPHPPHTHTHKCTHTHMHPHMHAPPKCSLVPYRILLSVLKVMESWVGTWDEDKHTHHRLPCSPLLYCYTLQTYNFFICVIRKQQLCSVFLQVGQQTAIAHEGHDDVRGWTSISAHPDQTNNIRVIEALHFYALRHHVINIFTTEVSWSYNKLSYLLGLSANIIIHK